MEFPESIYRNISKEFALLFLEKGEILFRPLAFYRAMEDPKRRDPNEGSVEAKFYHGTAKLIGKGATEESRPIVITEGTLNLTLEAPDQIYVACFSTREQKKFGEATIVIRDTNTFLRTITGFLEAIKLQMFAGTVEYYDRENVDLIGSQTKLGFMKSNDFSDEQEFRLAFRLPADHQFKSRLEQLSINERMLIFGVGDLSHVAKIEL